MKLYDIPMEIAFFEQELIEAGGELTPELEQRWDAFVKAGRDKVEGACMVVRNLEATSDACAAESKRLYDRANQTSKNAKRLKDLMVYAVDAFGGKVKTMLFSVWTQNAASRTSVELKEGADLVEIEKMHPQFVRVKRELNVEAVQEHLKAAGWTPAPPPAECDQCRELAEQMVATVAQWTEHHPKCTAEAEADFRTGLPDAFIVRWVKGIRYLRIK